MKLIAIILCFPLVSFCADLTLTLNSGKVLSNVVVLARDGKDDTLSLKIRHDRGIGIYRIQEFNESSAGAVRTQIVARSIEPLVDESITESMMITMFDRVGRFYGLDRGVLCESGKNGCLLLDGEVSQVIDEQTALINVGLDDLIAITGVDTSHWIDKQSVSGMARKLDAPYRYTNVLGSQKSVQLWSFVPAISYDYFKARGMKAFPLVARMQREDAARYASERAQAKAAKRAADEEAYVAEREKDKADHERFEQQKMNRTKAFHAFVMGEN